MKTNVLLALWNSYITAAITASGTSIVLSSVTSIPTVPFYALLDCGSEDEEVVRVTAVATATNTKTLTVVRAQGGTTGVAHAADTLFHACEINGVNIELDDLSRVLTGTSALNALSLTVTDETTGSSGYARGIYCAYTGSGAKTGTAEVNVIAADMTISGNTPHAFAVSLYTAISGSPTIDYLDGIYLYMDATGTATVNRKYGISLEIDNTNASTESAFIYLYRHGSTLLTACIRLETAGTGTATYFIKAPAISIAPFESGDITNGKSCIGGLRCINGSTVGVIPLYAD